MTRPTTDPEDAFLATFGPKAQRSVWDVTSENRHGSLRYWLCRCGFARTAATTCPLCGEAAPK